MSAATGPIRSGPDGSRCLPGPLQRTHPRDLPLRPAHLLPVVRRRRPGRARGHSAPHRAVADRDGGARSGRLDHRPATVHDLRVLPLRPHRRTDRVQPGPVRPPSQGLPERRAGTRPGRARHASSSPPSATTTTMPPWRCCWASTDYGSARPVPPTPRTWALTGATGRCASSARATSRP